MQISSSSLSFLSEIDHKLLEQLEEEKERAFRAIEAEFFLVKNPFLYTF